VQDAAAEIYEALGIDQDEMTWRDLALCRGVTPTNWFYEKYDDENISHLVDEMCLSCPVMKQCLQQGIENSEIGVWGAIYLNYGKKDDNKNKYKTPDTWKRIHERLSDD
jgi:hypothetical protein